MIPSALSHCSPDGDTSSLEFLGSWWWLLRYWWVRLTSKIRDRNLQLVSQVLPCHESSCQVAWFRRSASFPTILVSTRFFLQGDTLTCQSGWYRTSSAVVSLVRNNFLAWIRRTRRDLDSRRIGACRIYWRSLDLRIRNQVDVGTRGGFSFAIIALMRKSVTVCSGPL